MDTNEIQVFPHPAIPLQPPLLMDSAFQNGEVVLLFQDPKQNQTFLTSFLYCKDKMDEDIPNTLLVWSCLPLSWVVLVWWPVDCLSEHSDPHLCLTDRISTSMSLSSTWLGLVQLVRRTLRVHPSVLLQLLFLLLVIPYQSYLFLYLCIYQAEWAHLYALQEGTSNSLLSTV